MHHHLHLLPSRIRVPSFTSRARSADRCFPAIFKLLRTRSGRLQYVMATEDVGGCATSPAMIRAAVVLACILSGAARRGESARVFTFVNQCETTVWPAVIPGDAFGGGGFELRAGQSAVFTAPAAWSGRMWGRTECQFDNSGSGKCGTGSCGPLLKCGVSGDTPVSLAEFTLAAATDFYDVSLVDGFNLPITIRPVNGRGNCSTAGCNGDLRRTCPPELAKKLDGRTVACRSACDVFNTDEYCCRGQFGGPATCPPTKYSGEFKEACPTAYSYAYDDPSSLFQCSGADYIITFCSSSRDQSTCSYHNNKLECSAVSRGWPIMSVLVMVPLLSFMALRVLPPW